MSPITNRKWLHMAVILMFALVPMVQLVSADTTEKAASSSWLNAPATSISKNWLNTPSMSISTNWLNTHRTTIPANWLTTHRTTIPTNWLAAYPGTSYGWRGVSRARINSGGMYHSAFA